MRRNGSLTKVGVAFVLCAAACGGDKDPEPCPDVPPCITGSTWNASVCACLLNDEFVDAADSGKSDHAVVNDGGLETGAVGEEGEGEAGDANGASD